MGYTTTFHGQIAINPPLNEAERAYLTKFSETRRMNRLSGPYFVDGSGYRGQGKDGDIVDDNEPPLGQPGLWCQWVPTADGRGLEWDGGEKFYDSVAWMQYLIDHFLKSDAIGKGAPELAGFTFDHVLSGKIEAEGEERSDLWTLVVTDNKVEAESGHTGATRLPDHVG